MDRNRKRKATDAASPKVENSASKRQKTRLEHETPQTTTTIGLQFIDHLKSAKDKTGRLIADLFIDLPSKRELPDYYRTIKLPIAISTVQDKLERHEYPTLSTVESDIKRMVANAKQYNDDKSTVYQDAERIRKALSNFMTKHNPAYKDPNYIAIPTPIPGGDDDATASSAPPTRETSEQPKKITISLKANRDRKSSAAPPAASSPALAQDDSDPADFTGKTFQQAQEHIINGLISHIDQDLDIFQPFVTLPPRTLTDYYNIIKKPTSLTSVRKRVRGQHSRGPATMQTDFKTWDAFEDEVSYIWRNARDYNEDGSDIFNLSIEFEDLFKERLAIAKSQVDEPTQPKIKLNAPRPKPVLHLGARGSPAPRGTPADDKKEEAVTNGATASSAAASRSNSQVPTTANATAITASSPVATTTAVKTEKSVAASPSLATVRPQSIAPDAKQSPRPGTANAMLPPPSVRGISGSPHPSMLPHVPHVPQYVPPPTFLDKYARSKPVSEALLPSLVITAHPQLNNPKPFRLDVPPSNKFTQQSLTMAIPSAQYYISIIPTVSQRLLMQRQYKLFVTLNNVRLMSTVRDFMVGGVADRKIVYDTALNAGVNRIEVEVVAVSGRNGALEMEKVTVFANLLK
ncbi:Bromodomain-containing protein, partial [Aureobasidium melanogenum]|uniref:Bromodomain-domain-containing protein n=1 Tax=Aureobasidium melanogenum (strain CBS 110374) TaxID=1043003 RepID=A0A074W3P5_AURM1